MGKQFVGVIFAPGGKVYTFHNEGDPVKPGDRVRVDGRDGWQTVVCVSISNVAPSFETKPIIGIVPPEAA